MMFLDILLHLFYHLMVLGAFMIGPLTNARNFLSQALRILVLLPLKLLLLSHEALALVSHLAHAVLKLGQVLFFC